MPVPRGISTITSGSLVISDDGAGTRPLSVAVTEESLAYVLAAYKKLLAEGIGPIPDRGPSKPADLRTKKPRRLRARPKSKNRRFLSNISAHHRLSYPVDAAIGAVGLPKAFVGVVITLIVLMPEGLAAIKSALRNRLQNSINLALGSAIASIGLTIPVVAVVSIVLNRQIALGVSPTDMTLLILTLYIVALTLGTGRTTVLQGAVHLVIFAAFLLVSAVP